MELIKERFVELQNYVKLYFKLKKTAYIDNV